MCIFKYGTGPTNAHLHISLYKKNRIGLKASFWLIFKCTLKQGTFKSILNYTYFNTVMLSSEEDNMAAALFKLLFRKLSVDIH